jgi:hypothetical protein
MPDDTEQDRQTRCCQEDHNESLHARKAVQGDIAPSTKARALGKFVAA